MRCKASTTRLASSSHHTDLHLRYWISKIRQRNRDVQDADTRPFEACFEHIKVPEYKARSMTCYRLAYVVCGWS